MAPRGAGTKGLTKLRFFKILFDEDGSKVMYLPPMIAQEVPHLAGREIDIEDTSGTRWTVTVSQVNGSLAFQRGWRQFFSDHRLKKGELLVFKYIMGSHFVVRIYGLTACDRVNFDNEMSRLNKRVRRNPGPAVEEEPFQTTNINSRDIPLSDSPVASMVERSSVPLDMEVMMKKEDECYQGEDRSIWDDLSIFEPKDANLKSADMLFLPSPNESQNVSKSHIGFLEQVKYNGEDVQMDEVYACQAEGHSDESLTDKLEKPLNTKVSRSPKDNVDKTKKLEHDAKIDVIQTIQNEAHPNHIFTEKFKKAVETKTVPVHHKITKQVTEKGCDTQSAAILSSQSRSEHIKKLSESFRKEISDVSNVWNELYNGSPFIGTSKKVYEGKSWSHEFSFISPVAKDPSGKTAIKTEILEFEDEASCFPQASSGKEPGMVDNHEQTTVKVEPQFYDEKTAFDPFVAEVKSKSYLVLPEEITSFPGKERTKGGKIVYLRDSKERIWPLYYPNKPGVIALCLNWTNFCHENNIEPGDKCWFQFENAMPCIVRVDVIPSD